MLGIGAKNVPAFMTIGLKCLPAGVYYTNVYVTFVHLG